MPADKLTTEVVKEFDLDQLVIRATEKMASNSIRIVLHLTDEERSQKTWRFTTSVNNEAAELVRAKKEEYGKLSFSVEFLDRNNKVVHTVENVYQPNRAHTAFVSYVYHSNSSGGEQESHIINTIILKAVLGHFSKEIEPYQVKAAAVLKTNYDKYVSDELNNALKDLKSGASIYKVKE